MKGRIGWRADVSEVTAMAIDGTRHAWQGFTICLVSCAASWVLTLIVLGFHVIGIVPLAFIWVPIVSSLTREAARAGNPIAMTISLVFMVGLLGVGSAGVLAHTGVHLSAVGGLAFVWLVCFMGLALQLIWLRYPPAYGPTPPHLWIVRDVPLHPTG
jgi:hypothetical protein